MLIAQIIEESGIGRAQIARDSGLSTASLNAWTAKGKAARNPTPESVQQLATGLRTRAARLQELADELDRAGGDSVTDTRHEIEDGS